MTWKEFFKKHQSNPLVKNDAVSLQSLGDFVQYIKHLKSYGAKDEDIFFSFKDYFECLYDYDKLNKGPLEVWTYRHFFKFIRDEKIDRILE